MNPPVLLAVSHGTDSPAGQRAIERLVYALRLAESGIPVRGGFVDVQEPRVDQLLAALGPTDSVVVVSLLLTAGFHVHVDLAKSVRPLGARAVVAGALGPDAILATLLARRLRELNVADGDAVGFLSAASSTLGDAVRDARAGSRAGARVVVSTFLPM